MFRSALRVNAVVASATIVLIITNAFYWIHRDRATTIADHEVIVRDLASVVADQAARSVRDTDLALIQIAEISGAGGGPRAFMEKSAWEALHRIAARIPGCVEVLVAEPDGTVVATSATPTPPPMNVADPERKRVLAERDVLHIGPSAGSALAEPQAIYTVSRRLGDGKGGFAGTVSAGISTWHLTEFYDLLGFRKDPDVVVFRAEGDILARRPHVKEFIGRSIADRPLFRERLKQTREGVFRARSPMDGIDRINAYKIVEDTGLVVLVGIPWDRVTAEWRERGWRTGAVALLSIAVIGLAAAWGSASIRRARRAQAEREDAVIAKEEARQALDHALRDHLTGLPARALFLDQAEGLCGHCRRRNDRVAVMVIDLDGFKGVNDAYGHHIGDEVLVKAAAILLAALRETDVAGRIGGDEFGVCVVAAADLIEERAGLIAARIVDRMGAIGMGIGCSLGVAICPPACGGIAEALRRADEAMYQAKRRGKNQFAVWESAQGERPPVAAPLA